jgi:hypothetical protein
MSVDFMIVLGDSKYVNECDGYMAYQRWNEKRMVSDQTLKNVSDERQKRWKDKVTSL